MATLEDVQLELEIANEENGKFQTLAKKEAIFNQEIQLEQLTVLQGIFGILKDSFDFDKLLALKKSRELDSVDKDPKDSTKPIPKESVDDLEIPSKWQEIVGAVAGLVAGVVSSIAGIVGKIGKFLKEETVLANVINLFKGIGRALTKVFNSIKGIAEETKIAKTIGKIFKSVRGAFAGIVSEVKLFSAESKMVQLIGETFKTLGSTFGKVLETVKTIATENKLVKAFQSIGKTIGEIAGALKGVGEGAKISKLFSPVTKFFEMFAKVGKAIGSTFGKLLPPILLIMEVVEIVKGAFSFVSDEIEKGGNFIQLAVAGIIGAFTGFVNFFLEIPDLIFDAVSWLSKKMFGPDNPVSKFLDSFSLVEMFTDLMKGVKDIINHPVEFLRKGFEFLRKGFEAVGKGFEIAITGAVSFITNTVATAIDYLLKGFEVVGKGFESVITGVVTLITKPIETAIDYLLKGFEAVGKGFEIAITGAVSFITNTVEKFNQNIADFMEDPIGMMTKIILLPVSLLKSAVDFILDKLGFPALSALLPDVTGILQEFSDWMGGMIDDAIAWVKDALNFFGGSDEPAAPLTGKESVVDLVDQGVVQNTGKFNPLSAKIDESKLSELSGEQLDSIAAEYPSYDALQLQIKDEKSKRNESKRANKSPGTLQSAIQPPEIVNEIDDKYANPSRIVGLGQESVAQSQEMQVSQASYDQNKGPLRSGGGDVNASVIAPTTNNSTVNNSYLQSNQPSTRDDTDQMYIFRATGTSR